MLSGDKIEAIDLLTFDSTPVISGLEYNYPLTIAMDFMHKKLYFKNGTNIVKSNVDGTSEEIVLKNVSPLEITIDWKEHRIFWTNYFGLRIMVANMNGKNMKILKQTNWPARNLAVDPNKG